MTSQYTFTSSDNGKTYSRTLFGTEAMIASLGDNVDGFGFVATAFIAQLSTPCERTALEGPVRSAWLALRHLAPQIAVRTSEHHGQWSMTYVVPPSEAAADAWAASTIFWYDDEMPATARIEALGCDYWKLTNDAPGVQLHVCPISIPQHIWMFIVLGPHTLIDGRGGLDLLGYLLATLNGILSNTAVPRALSWGDEVRRLAATSALCVGGEANFERILNSTIPEPPPPPPDLTLFLPPSIEYPSSEYKVHNRRITLNRRHTSQLRSVCKSKGYTMTIVLEALFALANAEAIISISRRQGGTHKKVTEKMYKESTMWPIGGFSRDVRSSMTVNKSIFAPGGTPLCASECLPAMIPMNCIRDVLGFDEATGTYSEHLGHAFWDYLVPASANACTIPSAKDDPEAYLIREATIHSTVGASSADMYAGRTVSPSSVGNLDYYIKEVIRDIHPENKPASRAVTLLDICANVRNTLPLIIIHSWQYNGQISVALQGYGKYTSAEDLGTYQIVFRKWMDRLVQAGSHLENSSRRPDLGIVSSRL